MSDSEWLTIGDAAELLGVSARTLRRWDANGKLRAQRHPVNGYRVYRRCDLQSARPEPPAPAPEPPAPPPLFGRERVLEAIHGALQSGARLVTLWGAPGAGKSAILDRLLLALEDQVEIVCVGTGALSSSDEVAAALAAAVEVDADGDIAAAAVAAAGRGRRVLIAIDELLLPRQARSAVQAILEAAPRVTVLAVSRGPLDVSGEHPIEIGPLDPEAAAALFAVRARQAGVGDEAIAEASDAIASLLVNLDHLPRAIEVASQALLSHGPQELDARWQKRLAVAERGGGAACTVSAIFERIAPVWAALDEVERAVLTQCSVFRGGFTARAAAAVVACPRERRLNDLLRALRAQSLLRGEFGDDGEYRFHSYSIAQVFLEKNGDRDLLAEAVERHARYYVGLAGWPDGATGPGPFDPRVVGRERANLVAIAGRKLPAALRARALVVVMRVDNGNGSARRGALMDEVIDVARPEGASVELGHLFCARVDIATQQGDGETAERVLTWAREVGATLGDERLLAETDLRTGVLTLLHGDDPVGAGEAFERAARQFAARGDRAALAAALRGAGHVHMVGGRLSDAIVSLERALGLYRGLGDGARTAATLADIALACGQRGEHQDARGGIDEALGLVRDDASSGHVAAVAARVMLDAGEAGAARYHAEWAVQIARGAFAPGELAQALVSLAEVELTGGRPRRAVQAAREACSLAADASASRIEGHARLALGIGELATGRDTAQPELERAATLLEHAGDLRHAALARAYLAVGGPLAGRADDIVRALAEARRVIGAGEDRAIAAAIEVLVGFAEQANAIDALMAGSRLEAMDALANARARAIAPGQPAPARIAARLLSRSFRVLAGRELDNITLTVGADTEWFRIGEDDVVDLRTRPRLRVVVETLTGAARVADEALVVAAWPDEPVAAALPRLRSVISELRRLGFAEHLSRDGDGYRLIGNVVIEEAPTVVNELSA